LHVSYSNTITGVGSVAGGPYWCAQNNVLIATTACMTQPNSISIPTLIGATSYAYSTLSIDNPANLAKSKVWMFSGQSDSVVAPGVVQKLQTYYQNYISSGNIQAVYNMNTQHAMITNSYGNSCNFLGLPYINNCGYDAAGVMLQWLLGSLNGRGTVKLINIITVQQSNYIPGGLIPSTVGLQSVAYAYVPTGCRSNIGACDMHIAFHGCHQTINEIGSSFYAYAGYNQWAETNNIVILYPQAAANSLNPEGCWDWWGYTGSAYATKLGVQVATVMNMARGIQALSFEDLIAMNATASAIHSNQ